MNSVHMLTSELWVVRLGWTLLHFLWQGTAIAIVYAAIRFVFARSLTSGARYTLACGAMLAMAFAPLATFLTLSNDLPARAASWSPAIAQWKWLPPAAVALWISGVFWYSLRLFGAVQFTRRLRDSAHPVPEIWQQTLQQIAQRLGFAAGHRVRLMSSSMVSAPAVIGYLRPMVLVPVAFLTGLPAEQIIPILTHEMAHIRRKDYLACILQSIVEVALFYHPAVWWISSQVRSERELSCDDLVIAAGADRLTYARALTELEAVRPRRLAPSLAANGGSLMHRIRRVIEPSYIGSHELPGAGAAWAMLLLLFIGAGVVPVHGAQKTVAIHRVTFRSTAVPAPQPPANSDSLVLFDPLLPIQLAQLLPALPPAAQPANSAGPVMEQVTARTADDLALDGLRAEDFTVTEDGKPQHISVFEYQNIDRNANRRIVLYFDMTSMPQADRLRSLDAAQKFIGTQMGQTDTVALIRHATAGVEVLQDFTSDRGKLLSVLSAMSAAVAEAPHTTPSEKLSALQTVVKKLAPIGDKKSLVYFSNGLNLGAMDNHAQLRVTVNDAVRVGVSIWPTANDDALNTLATDSGAKPAVADSTDPAATIAAAQKSIGSYYLIGYTPTNQAHDGNYRRIEIVLNNNADAKLTYRQGYFARVTGEQQLEDAFHSGDPATDLALAAEVNYFRINKAESFTPITVQIPTGAARTALDIVAEIKDAQGTSVQTFRDRVENNAFNSVAVWNAGAKLLPGSYSVKILARDSVNSRMGTFVGSFTIENLDKDPRLPISSVVLSNQFADEVPSGTATNPLIHDGKRMIPSVTRVFSAKNDMNVYLQAFESGAKTTAPLMARVAFYKGSDKILETPPITVAEGLDPKSFMLPIRMNVGLSSLKPGEYDCQVTVLDPATQKSALWQKPVTIVQ